MNFKNICLILSLLSLNCKVLSSPLNDNTNGIELTTETVDAAEPEILSFEEESSEEEVSVSVDDIVEEIDSMSEIEIPESEECLTSECYEVSKNILTNLDFSIDPCDDFYQFSCGGYINEHENEDFNPIEEMYYKDMNDTIKYIVGEYESKQNMSKIDQEYDEKLFNKVKDYFNSCMAAEDTNDDNEKETILKLVSNLKIKENKEYYKTKEGLTDLVILFHDYLSSFLFDLDLYNYDIHESRSIGLRSSQTLLYKNNGDDPEFTKYLKEVLLNFVIDIYQINEQDGIELVNSIYEIEKQMMNNIDENEEPIEITLKELKENYSFIDWQKYLTVRFEKYNVKTEVNDNLKFSIESPSYFKNLDDFIQNVDFDALINYLELVLIHDLYEYLEILHYIFKKNYQEKLNELKHPFEGNKIKHKNTLIKEYKKIQKLVNKIHKREYEEEPDIYEEPTEYGDEMTDDEYSNLPRDQLCFNVLEYLMSSAISRYYILNKFDENIKNVGENMIHNVKEAMLNRLPQMEWLDEPTRNYAIEKVSKIKEEIGYRDYIMDPEYLYKKYEPIEIDSENFVINLINTAKYYLNKMMFDIIDGLSEEEEEESESAIVINAFYEPYSNTMIFPAGIFQSPYYYSNAPEYINYGGIGMVIGHELTHAFDGNGKLYGINGEPNNWWTDNDNEEFDEYSQCFIDQYNSFYVEDKNGVKHFVDGEETLNENLADNGGISRAYEAWKISMNKDAKKAKENNKSLPGLSDFSIDQLFFISYSQGWCSSESKESIINRMEEDDHSPYKSRVNGVTSNSELFAKVFNCPGKSKMNPSDKCTLW